MVFGNSKNKNRFCKVVLPIILFIISCQQLFIQSMIRTVDNGYLDILSFFCNMVLPINVRGVQPMYERFKGMAEAVGAEVHRFAKKADLCRFVISFLQAEGIADNAENLALWADNTFIDKSEKEQLESVSGLKFNITRELASSARFGISQINWAVSDTGTLVQNSSDIEQRLVSSLSSIHIAIVPTDNILPDMPTLLSKIHPAEAGYIAMITGPSRTADIERVLTIGVHGPKRLIILFCDELERRN